MADCVILHEHRKQNDYHKFEILNDQTIGTLRFSAILKIVLSYIDYVNEFSWKKLNEEK